MSSDTTLVARIEAASVVKIPVLSINRSEALKRGDRITVVFRNVMLPDRTGDALFDISDTIHAEYPEAKIMVLPPTLSDIRVTPHNVKEKSTRDITVTYQVRHRSGLTDNAVSITLPSGLTDSTFLSTFRVIPRGVTTLPADPLPTGTTKADYQYVTVTDTVAKPFSAAPAVFGSAVTFTGDMTFNEEITVIYHNAVILPLSMDREARLDHIQVTDSAISYDGLAYQTAVYRPKIRITTTATVLSVVDVTPDPVKGGQVRNMVVTYTARDEVFDNRIEIDLPSGWGPKYSTFGSAARTDAGPANTSYVRVDTTGGLVLAEGSLTLVGPAGLSLTLKDGKSMPNGSKITVTYQNVQVPELSPTQLANRPPPDANIVTATFDVSDTITGDPAKYDEMATVTVEHPDLSDIQVMLKMVKEGSIINKMTVTYTAKDIIYTNNRIDIRIPAGWDPAYPAVSADFVNEIDLLPTADKSMTSYVRITPRPANMDLTINNITSDGVDMMVNGDMGNGNRITVAFYNVRVRELPDREPKDDSIRVTDKLSADGNSKCCESLQTPYN